MHMHLRIGYKLGGRGVTSGLRFATRYFGQSKLSTQMDVKLLIFITIVVLYGSQFSTWFYAPKHTTEPISIPRRLNVSFCSTTSSGMQEFLSSTVP